jgi:hypothetical protein
MAGASHSTLPPELEREFWSGIEHLSRFSMGEANVQQALRDLVATLESLQIPYAVVGALALGEFGYRRATVDVDILLTPEGLESLKREVLGRGYRERVAGGRGLRDTRNGVDVDVILTGGYPGDGKPKPVRFPDPGEVAVRGDRVALLPLPKLLDLKLASGMSAPHRLRDLADVLELIRIARLSRNLAETLDPSVRDKYLDLWDAAQAAPDD